MEGSLIGRVQTGTPALVCVVGTRPEAIKMAPLILKLRECPDFRVRVLASGQHADMLHQALSDFGIRADADLCVMKDRQTLDHITSAVLEGVGGFLDANPQDMLLVHGDTTTTLSAALAGFYRNIPVVHVEAGLRSRDMTRPFPEEANRVLVDRLATLYFAPTRQSADNLLAEGADARRVFVTGNTVIDALFWTLEHRRETEVLRDVPADAPLVLMTAHRRESWGEPLVRVCKAVRGLLERHAELWVVIPLHKNPVVRNAIREELKNCARVVFTEPLNYPDFVAVMNRSLFIMSDSGGIQEEASALRKPVLILRELSERPEALTMGTGVLVGTNRERIGEEASRLLTDSAWFASFSERGMPFGDGSASKRIVNVIGKYFAAKGFENESNEKNDDEGVPVQV
ncbi:MAG: UDP-N-acetylglucosamine 2-epimerase (non-hydrolyzing) [Synergistaceae bacterium]|nr:UDP-N-acetylglucosamine 2-epimerase (non-hydrolyzing) [Synergistaceae bacterium]